MSDPLSWSGGLVERYGATVVGLLIGNSAKYGMMLTEGRRPRPVNLLADLLLLSMLGVIALTIGDVAGLLGLNLSSNTRVLSGALAAVSSDRLVRLVVERYMKRFEDNLPAALTSAPSVAAVVPAGTGMPDAVQAQTGTPDDAVARAGTALRSAYRDPARPSATTDQIALLRALEDLRPQPKDRP